MAHPAFGTVRARSSSRNSGRSSVPSYEARLLPVQHPTTPPSSSLRSGSVATRKSQIESPLLTRKPIPALTSRTASPAPDSPVPSPRLCTSLRAVFQDVPPPNTEREQSEHGQQYSPLLPPYVGQTDNRIFDSPLALDATPPLVPTYNQVEIGPSRMARPSFPSSRQNGQLDGGFYVLVAWNLVTERVMGPLFSHD